MNEELLTEFKAFKASIDQKLGTVDGDIKAASQSVFDKIMSILNSPESGGRDRGGERKMLADIVTASPEFQAFAKSWKQGSCTLEVPTLEFKTTIDSTSVGSSTPGILVPERAPGIVQPGVPRIRIRNLLPQYQTANNAIEFVKENVYNSAAYPQVESSAKGESAMTFTIGQAAVRTLAHWIPVSRQVFDDFVQLQPYLNLRLTQGLLDREDFELLRGDGTGQHINGLITQATPFDTSRTVAADTKIDTLGHALSQLEESNFNPDGIVMNPNDWRKICLFKTEEGGANKGQYLLGSPADSVRQSLWGLPVVLTTAMVAGRFLVGSFSIAASLWERQAVVIDISNQHSDFFTKNLLAVRCEERIGLAVFQPTALVYGAF